MTAAHGDGPIFLVRHAKAGSKSKWSGDDRLRPLSRAGERQARRLVELFADVPVAQIRSSPYVRCMDTVRPLAEARGLPVLDDELLSEGAPTIPALVMLADAPPGTIVCSHGDLIPAIVETLASDGVSIAGETGWRKGSTWILERGDGRIVRARYLPPPDETDERPPGGSGTWTDAPAG